jgi:hypothetical protein
MSSPTRLPKGAAIDAAMYQHEKGLTNKEIFELFGVSSNSLNCARHRHGIPHPFPGRNATGVAIAAVKTAIYTDATIKEAMTSFDVNRGTMICAARRMGINLRKLNPNRNIMTNRDTYYFRVRTKSFKAFWFLGKDIDVARLMRDQLEVFFKTLK